MTDIARKTDPVVGIDNGQVIFTGAGLLMHSKVSVKGSGGVSATVVIMVQQGQVWMSIQPPFTWQAVMDPWQVDELIRTLELAADGAKKMARPARP